MLSIWRVQSMGGRWYCYTYANKLADQGSVVLCLRTRSRPIPCHLLLFLTKAGWTRPGWLLGCAQPRARGCTAAPGKGRVSHAQMGLCGTRWHRGHCCDGLQHLTWVRQHSSVAWESEEEANLVYGRGESVPVPVQ